MHPASDRSPGAVLADALDPAYAYSSPYDLEDAWEAILGSVTPAEAVGLTRAARTIGRSTARVVRDPAVARVLSTAAPVAGAAVAGPLGARAGSHLGSLAVSRLGTPPAPAAPGGSIAAAQLLVLLAQPEVQQALLRVALGQHGRRTPVNGVPVPALTSTLSSIAAQAAEDAAALDRAEPEDEFWSDDGWSDSDEPGDEPAAIYRTLVAAADAQLAEVVDGS